jgi:regulatory protein
VTNGRRRESFAEKRERKAAIDDPAVVLEAAARFLEARAGSVVEVRRRLTTAGYRPDLIEAAIERLTEIGVLDDAAFAQGWIESRDRARPRGERALADELRLRGVERSVIVAALDVRRDASAVTGSEDDDGVALSADEAAAARLLERNSRLLARVADPRARRQRAYALLARNGFDPSVCAALSARVMAAPDEDAD